MFTKGDGGELVPMLAGVFRKTLVHGAKTLLAEFHLGQGHVIPRHAHPHEQTGYLVSGRLRFTLGDEAFEARPGDGWCVPGGVEHGVEILEDSVAIEVFSPVREDYLPGAR
jgi:quercetin dioxygenase-like cupin family protein